MDRSNTIGFKLILGIAALTISLIYGSFHILWLKDRRWQYRDTIFISSIAQCRDTYHYIGQLKEVYEGHYRIANPYLAEYKQSKHSVLPVLPVWVAALFGMLCHLDVQYLVVLMDFILPPTIFLLTYRFFAMFTIGRSSSLFGAFLLTLTPLLFFFERFYNYVTHPFITLYGVIPSFLYGAHGGFGYFSRTLTPQLTYIFFFTAVLFFLRGCLTHNTRHFMIAAGFGIMTSYSNIFFSTYLYTFLGLTAIISLLLKQRYYGYKALLTLGVVLCCSIPFWYSLAGFSGSTFNQTVWMERSHAPIITFQVAASGVVSALILWLLFFKQRIQPLIGITTLSLLVSGIICVNQQVLTGIHVQAWHYELYLLPPAMLLTAILITADYTRRRFLPESTLRRWWLKPVSLGGWLLWGSILVISLSILLHPATVTFLWALRDMLPPHVRGVLHRSYSYGLFLGGLMLLSGILLEKYPVFRRFVRIRTMVYASIMLYMVWDLELARYVWYHDVMKPNFADLQDLAPALQWLRTHTAKESVVLSMFGRGMTFPRYDYASTEALITIYTENNVYFSEYAAFHPAPQSELHDRLYNLMYFAGIRSEKEFQQFLNGMWMTGSFAAYQAKLRQPLYPALKTYQADYLFYGPRERRSFKIDPGSMYPFLQELYNDGIVRIYRIV